MRSSSRPSPSKEKTTSKPAEAWAYWELQANGRYALAVSHGERPRTRKASEGDPTPQTEPKPVPAALLGADGVSPDFGAIEKTICPRPIREGEAAKRAKEEAKRAGYLDHISDGI